MCLQMFLKTSKAILAFVMILLIGFIANLFILDAESQFTRLGILIINVIMWNDIE
jgi:fumarate reductase subunit D